MLCKLLQLHCGRYHYCCESLGTRQSHQQNFSRTPRNTHRSSSETQERSVGSGKTTKVFKNRRECGERSSRIQSFSLSRNKHGTKKQIGNRPEEEAKKTKCYKRLIYKQFVKVSGPCGPQFLVICRDISSTFIELCMETPYLCTVLVHKYGRRKSIKTSGVHFFYKISFFSLES